MPQSIFIQVGQCGNQIGYRFWDLAIQEYSQYNSYAEDIGNFFKIGEKSSSSNILENAKARAVLIDMEEGVVSELINIPLKCIFDRKQLITDVSGSGNNWAVGNKFYGSKYKSHIIEKFRKEAEECDSLQCFFLLHSMGGGTGSGLGTAVVEYLYDEFPKTPRFTFSAYPSLQDDVVTSPYNTVLANSKLIHFASCVFPYQNRALIDIGNKAMKMKRTRLTNHCSGFESAGKSTSIQKAKSFNEMNDIVANVLINLTCSSRFPGSLNVDINEIIMNMTPYPRLHYLIPSASPLIDNCKINQIFTEAFSPSHQLFPCSITQGVLLACALLCRGHVSISDVQSNIERLKGNINFVPWNDEGWKVGLCSIPHISYPYSVLMLSNTSSIVQHLIHYKESFLKMFRKRAHLHHFLEVEGMEMDTFRSSMNDLNILIDEYKDMELVFDHTESQQFKFKL